LSASRCGRERVRLVGDFKLQSKRCRQMRKLGGGGIYKAASKDAGCCGLLQACNETQPASRALGDHGPFDKPPHKTPTAPSWMAEHAGLWTRNRWNQPLARLGSSRPWLLRKTLRRQISNRLLRASKPLPPCPRSDPGPIGGWDGIPAQVWIVENQFSQCPSCHCHGAPSRARVQEWGPGCPESPFAGSQRGVLCRI
jgi:hypothetical protein